MKKYEFLENYLVEIDRVIENGKYKDTWESLADYEVPQWYKDAKFGIFSHFGLYSVAEKNSEWYSRQMYMQGHSSYLYHLENFGDHKEFGYKEFIELFKPVKFNSLEWIETIKKSGARYYIPVAEHHDGYQMYESGLSDYNTVNIGPGVDYIKQLVESGNKNDIEIGVSSHRAEHYFFFEGALDFDSGINKPEYGDLYWPTIKESDLNKDEKTTTLFLEDWLVRCCELVDLFNPKIVYFDWWIETDVFKPYILKFAAYYYNKMEQQNTKGIINYKHDGYMYSSAVRDMERGQFANIQPDYWQCCTSLSNNSWSFVKNNTYKTTKEILQTLIDVVSKNGNLLLNIGPKADGSIPKVEIDLLNEIGNWMKINGAAIYESKVWKVYGEGPTNTSGGDFSENSSMMYNDLDFRFTRNKDKLYVFALNPVEGEVIKIRSLRKKNGLLKTHGVIKDVKLLSGGEVKDFKRKDFSFDINYEINDYSLPIVFELTMG